MTSTSGLNARAFAKLMARLADDPEQAGEAYEDLRRVMLRFFEWRGAPHPDEHADETLNRVARKLEDGVEVRSIGAYCHEVARYVLLEALRSRDLKNVPLDAVEFSLHADSQSDGKLETESRLACLDQCLSTLAPENRDLIIEYYRAEGSHIEHRQKMAQRFGLRRDALRNRAQRLRDKLETCVKRCMRKNE